MRVILSLVGCSLLIPVLPLQVHGQAQAISKEKRAEISELLDRSPLLEPTMSVVKQARFVRDSKTLLRTVSGWDETTELSSVTEATKALEKLLGNFTIEASVSSQPTGLIVSYRRLVDVGAPEKSVTTDGALQLQPALYLFRCKDPTTGEVTTQRVSCATNCQVKFVFKAEPGD